MSESKKKVCPLMKVAGEPANSVYCTRDCAWYVEDTEKCAVFDLAESVRFLEDHIATMVDFGIQVKR